MGELLNMHDHCEITCTWWLGLYKQTKVVLNDAATADATYSRYMSYNCGCRLCNSCLDCPSGLVCIPSKHTQRNVCLAGK